MTDPRDTQISSIDKIIAIYKQGVDVTLLRENLKLTVTQRIVKLQQMQEFAEEVARAGMKSRRSRE